MRTDYPIEEPTARELEVLALLAQGYTNKQISISLCITVRTVEFHLTNIFLKLNSTKRTEAVAKAVKANWLKFENFIS